MAEFSGSVDTGEAIGQREDLSDLIWNLSPTETPFLMMCARGSASSTTHEWQMDSLAAAGANVVLEGDQVAAADVYRPTVRLAMPTQISDKAISVSGTVEVVSKAGRNSELSFQLAKRAKELKRDIEWACVGNTTVANMASAAGLTRRIGAVQTQFHADWYQEFVADGGETLAGVNIIRGTGGTAGADGGWDKSTTTWDAPTDCTVPEPLLEADVQAVIQGAWTNGGDPTIIMVGPFNKRVVSGFTGNSTRFDRGEDQRLVAAISVYVSDYGEHRVVPNRFQRERDVFVFTPELQKVCFLRPFRQHALAKQGDSEERQLLAEWCLEHNNNAGNGIVADRTAQ